MISLTYDYDYIKALITHSNVWPWVSDDAASIEDFEPSKSMDHLLIEDNGERIGFFIVHPINGFCLQIHTVIDPKYWGSTVKYAKEVLIWIFSNTRFLKVITFIPETNTKAKRLAEKAGMIQEGVIKNSFLKNGSLVNQYIFGIEKVSICQ